MSQYPGESGNQNYPPPYPPPPASGYPPPYPGYQPYYPGPMAPATSPWAIASLICSIVGVSLLGIIFGHIALSQIKQSRGWYTGYGMALAGLIIGYAGVAISVVVLMVIIVVRINAAGSPM